MLNVYGPALPERITHGVLDAEDGVFAHDQQVAWRSLRE